MLHLFFIWISWLFFFKNTDRWLFIEVSNSHLWSVVNAVILFKVHIFVLNIWRKCCSVCFCWLGQFLDQLFWVNGWAICVQCWLSCGLWVLLLKDFASFRNIQDLDRLLHFVIGIYISRHWFLHHTARFFRLRWGWLFLFLLQSTKSMLIIFHKL